ncbi:MAG: hypothetical protein IPG87_14345 [Saprospiraceae bacterium]|nr:hypothetical protein [Candidatus Vicinibacter affinis]
MVFNKFLSWSIGSFFALLVIASCVDRAFDEPPVFTPTIPFSANSSIVQLKSKYIPGQFITITEELNIIATVIADDRSGNFYKTLVIQDSTGGIEVKINSIGLFALFPIGTRVGIKCKNLTIGDYAGLIQLGQGSYLDNGRERLAGIEDALLDQYVFAGERNKFVTPKTKSINALNSLDLSTLIKLEDVEFDRAELGKTYANVATQTSQNVILVDCNKASLLLRTSGFADFANFSIPAANGSLTGVLSKFNTDVQIYIRDTSDILFNKTPCGGGSGQAILKSISEIRSLYSGAASNISEDYKILGIVTSDKDNSNVNARNLFIQDASGAITVRFSANHSYALGDELEINLKGIELSEFNGLLQLNNVPVNKVTKISSGKSISPKQITIGELLTSFENYESQLVQIVNASLSKSSGTTYTDNVEVNDQTGKINLFTSQTAKFANDVFPSAIVKITAIVSQFNSKQLLIRNLNDVVITGGGGGQSELKSIKFIRDLFVGTLTNVSGDFKVKGIVSSEKNALNVVTQNVFIQDATAAIVIRFSGNHSFNLGDEIEVVVKGVELSEFNGLLQLNSTPLANAKLITSGNQIQPRVVTIAQIISEAENWEGQLLKILNPNFSKSSGTNYSGTVIINDGTGTIDLFTRSQANFAADNFPTSAKSITGILSQFTARQLIMRTVSDIEQ